MYVEMVCLYCILLHFTAFYCICLKNVKKTITKIQQNMTTNTNAKNTKYTKTVKTAKTATIQKIHQKNKNNDNMSKIQLKI